MTDTVNLSGRQIALLRRDDLWALVDQHGSILRAAVREPEHRAELGELNAAVTAVQCAIPISPACEARVRAALREILRMRRQREAATPRR